MKNILSILVLMIASSVAVTAQWTQTSGPEGGRISSIAVDGSTLLASTWSGAIYRHDEDRWSKAADLKVNNLLAANGIFLASRANGSSSEFLRSTDRGSTWQSAGLSAMSIALTVGNNMLYASVNDTIQRSSNGGGSWEILGTKTAGITTIAVRGSTIIVGSGWTLGMFRSSDNGATWETITSEIPFGALPTAIVVSGTTFYVSLSQYGVFRSTDDGISWQAVNAGLPGEATNLPTFQSLIVNGNALWGASSTTIYRYEGVQWEQVNEEVGASFTVGNGLLYSTSASGVQKSSDQGATWVSMNDGLRINDVSALAVLEEEIYANAATGIFKTTNAGASWEKIAPYTIDEFMTTTSAIYARAQGYTGDGVLRSTNNGQSWERVNSGITQQLDKIRTIASGENALFAGFYETFSFHGNSHWESGGIFRSTDGGENWQAVNSGLPNDGFSVVPVVDIVTQGTTVVATTLGGLYRSTNNGSSWSKVATGLPAENSLDKLAVSGETIYLSSSGKIYRSINGGESWTSIDPELPQYSHIISISIVQGMPIIIANTTAGFSRIFRFNGTAWIEITDEMPNDVAFQTFIEAGNTLFAGTAGSSAWSSPLQTSAGIAGTAGQQASIQVRTIPNPVLSKATVELTMNMRGHAGITILNALGQNITHLYGGVLDAGTHRIDFDAASLLPGVYLYRVITDHGTATGKLVKMQ